jgi:hypothetical protein
MPKRYCDDGAVFGIGRTNSKCGLNRVSNGGFLSLLASPVGNAAGPYGVKVGRGVMRASGVLLGGRVGVYEGVGVLLGVKVNVGVGVLLGVNVGVRVGVDVRVYVAVNVEVDVRVSVAVFVGVRVPVEVLLGVSDGPVAVGV